LKSNFAIGNRLQETGNPLPKSKNSGNLENFEKNSFEKQNCAMFVFLKNLFNTLMENCLWGFYGGWIFEHQWGPLMVIFHHGDAAEEKGEEVKGGAI